MSTPVGEVRPHAVGGGLLVADGVSKRWPKSPRPILDRVSLSLPEASLVTITGSNGAGKTTLLRILAGLIFPDSGHIRLGPLDPRRRRRDYQRSVALLSAGYGGLYARLTVRQQLLFSARLALLARDERRSACDDALARFELFSLANRRVDRLSMGERQRIRLAIAFLGRPRVVLLDEPWNSLDETGEHLLAASLIQFRSGGGTAVCCTPSGKELARWVPADTALHLANGQLVET